MPKDTPPQEKKHIPELLAPAGSPEAFQAVVASGADAVYLSGKQFGARKFAPNFSDPEIEEAVTYAHTRGIRVYVTVNTLIHDRELPGVAEYLIRLYAAGVDAVLVQDIGVAALAREIVPDLPIHASTQMTIHNSAGVRWAAQQGFSRVVLSRELTLEEITLIAEETRSTGVGLEVFAHGALCYCYSGQCLLSSVIGGRSGNRGMCAQPCRKPYTLVSGTQDTWGRPLHLREIPSKEKFLLSTKDLCTYEHLPELVGSPVTSLKIEGRMKSSEYGAIVVSTYRKALDAIAAGHYKASPESTNDLLLAFNRGFTSGYLFNDRNKALMGRDAPDNRGVSVGKVPRQDERTGAVFVRQSGTFTPDTGDGILFSNPERPGAGQGFSLNNVPVKHQNDEISFVVPFTVPPGADVSVTFSRSLDLRARQIRSHPPVELKRPVSVDLCIDVNNEGALLLEGQINTGLHHDIRVSYRPDLRLVPARSRPLTQKTLELQVRKTGGTPFVIRNLSISYAGDLFIPLAALNDIRREFLKRAESALVAASRPSPAAVERARGRFMVSSAAKPARVTVTHVISPLHDLRLAVFSDTVEGVSAAANAGCDVVCFEPGFASLSCQPDGKRQKISSPSMESLLASACDICHKAGVRLIWKLPRITHDAYLMTVLSLLPTLTKQGISACRVENPGTAQALLALEPSLEISGSVGLNVFNHVTAQELSSAFRLLTLSPELSGDEIRNLIDAARSKGCPAAFSLIVEGNSEAMVSEDCVLVSWRSCPGKTPVPAGPAFFGLKDSTGHIFPVWIDSECRTHIGNSPELCLLDHLVALSQMGIGEAVIDARGRTPAYTGEMTRIYHEATALVNAGAGQNDPRFFQLKDRVLSIAIGSITAGHFIRGLKE